MKTMKKNKLSGLIPALLSMTLLFHACSAPMVQDEHAQNEFEASGMLAEYLESNGNYINSPQVPAIMTAPELFSMLGKNILIIDLRSQEQFDGGHIEGAVNIEPSGVLAFFDHKIDAPSFERVVFVCSMGQLSAYVTGLMRLAGYDNTYSMRYGMSAWNRSAAASGWDLVPGSSLENSLVKTPFPKNNAGSMPQVKTTSDLGHHAIREHIVYLLEQPKQQFLISYDTLTSTLSDYYIVNYWSEEQYNFYGHLVGAVQYSPKQSLGLNTGLLTLPAGRPVVVYCNNGHHSAHVAAFLRVLGYDAYSLQYGANAFMAGLMSRHEKKPHTYWNESNSLDYPLVMGRKEQNKAESAPVEIKSTVGGC